MSDYCFVGNLYYNAGTYNAEHNIPRERVPVLMSPYGKDVECSVSTVSDTSSDMLVGRVRELSLSFIYQTYGNINVYELIYNGNIIGRCRAIANQDQDYGEESATLYAPCIPSLEEVVFSERLPLGFTEISDNFNVTNSYKIYNSEEVTPVEVSRSFISSYQNNTGSSVICNLRVKNFEYPFGVGRHSIVVFQAYNPLSQTIENESGFQYEEMGCRFYDNDFSRLEQSYFVTNIISELLTPLPTEPSSKTIVATPTPTSMPNSTTVEVLPSSTIVSSSIMETPEATITNVPTTVGIKSDSSSTSHYAAFAAFILPIIVFSTILFGVLFKYKDSILKRIRKHKNIEDPYGITASYKLRDGEVIVTFI